MKYEKRQKNKPNLISCVTNRLINDIKNVVCWRLLAETAIKYDRSVVKRRFD